ARATKTAHGPAVRLAVCDLPGGCRRVACRPRVVRSSSGGPSGEETRAAVTGSDVRGDVLTLLDTAAARRWAVVTRAALAARRAEIDALNVFPVPDVDTGANLSRAVDAALDSARVEYEDRARRGHPMDDEDLATE